MPSAFPVNIGMDACPMFRGEGGKPSLQVAAVERGVVGDDEYDPLEQIVDGGIVNALTGDHLIGDPGQGRDFRGIEKPGSSNHFQDKSTL